MAAFTLTFRLVRLIAKKWAHLHALLKKENPVPTQPHSQENIILRDRYG